MNNQIQPYYEMANQYYSAAVFINNNLIDTPDLYNPLFFLFRHSYELALKGLIIKETVATVVIDNPNDVPIVSSDNKQKKMSNEHSLLVLWNNYNTLFDSKHICQSYSPKEYKVIDSCIKYINKLDENSTIYRYSYKKNGIKIQLNPLDIVEVQKMPELGSTPPFIMKYEEQIYRICKGERILLKINQLSRGIEMLIQQLKNK